MKQILETSEYLDIVSRYYRKDCRSNDYIQQIVSDLIAEGCLFVGKGQNNVFFFVKKAAGLRVYYYINDVAESFDFTTQSDLVTEILFRGDLPQEEIKFFECNGFQVNLVRDQYSGMYKDLYVPKEPFFSEIIAPAATIEDVEAACNLFDSSFDCLSGDYIPREDYESLLSNHQIIIAQKNENFLGAIHQVKEGSVNVIGHIAVMESARGKGIGNALVRAFIEKNYESEKTRYQLWVQRQNEAAVNMYKKFGFKFINKSTISLIKKR